MDNGDLTRLAAAETAITAVAGAVTGSALPVLGVWVVTGALPAGAIAAAPASAPAASRDHVRVARPIAPDDAHPARPPPGRGILAEG